MSLSKVKPTKLIRDLILCDTIIKIDETIDAIKINPEEYIVFHHTGWSIVHASYFEKENHTQCVCTETSSRNCPVHDKGE